MIHLRYSNRMEQLVAALASALPPSGDGQALLDGLFDGPWLVFPSRPLELYVELELARRRGIAGTIETLSLPGAFARLCTRALPDVVLIERGHIVGELLALLADEAVADSAALAEIQAYVTAAGDAPEAVARRRVDLARALGGLFDEWSLTRPELLAAWRTGAPMPGVDGTPLGRAERALWAGLFGSGGRFELRSAVEGRRYLTLDGVFSESLDAAWLPPPALHVFGLSQVPRGLQRALARLGSRTEVLIYAVNPCREFWEDVETRAPRRAGGGAARGRGRHGGRAGGKSDGRQLELTGFAATTTATATAVTSEDAVTENPVLRVWGHAGRESTRLLNQLSDGDFEATFVAPAPDADTDTDTDADTTAPAAVRHAGAVGIKLPTLLAHLQQDILDRRPPRSGVNALDLAADDSIKIVGAPNQRRELETIAAEIWSLVRADATAAPAAGPPLRFSDIAVLIAGNEEPYLGLARAVFREAEDLPHAIVDQAIGAGSHLIEAVLALMALPLGTFTRREVLDVITHPNVRARFPDADPQVWLKLCEDLTIAHGADRAALADTYIEDDVFNWDQGLKRLALGLFASGPASGAEDPIVLGAQAAPADERAYLPAEVPSDMADDAHAMALLVRSLLADAAFARKARLSVTEWTRFVRALLGAYVVPVTPDDESARLRVFTALDQLAAQAPTELLVTLGTATELVRGALSGLRGTRGQMLGAGVVVGTLGALRSIPFRAIFVVGLGAERFPRPDRPSPLELDIEQARPGDVTGRQQDRYLFLETLLAARDSVVLSHVDRDALTGETREPSPVVLELLEHLRHGYLRADEAVAAGTSPAAGIVRSVPLHRDEDHQVHATFRAAALEAHARLAGAELQSLVPAVAGLGTTKVIGALSAETRRLLAPALRLIEIPGGAEGGGGGGTSDAGRTSVARPVTERGWTPPMGRAVLQLADLRRFLECPLQGSARVFLGLRDLPDDTEARETGDEPFDVPRWLERSLLTDVLAAAWNGAALPDSSRLQESYREALDRPRNRRLLPVGPFRANVRRRHLGILQQWVEALTAIGGPAGSIRGPARRVCFGRPDPLTPAGERRAPLRVTLDLPHRGPTAIELHGTTEPQATWVGVIGGDAAGGGSGSLVLAVSTDKERNDKDTLRAFIDHVALAASRPEGETPAPFTGAICRPSRDGSASAAQPVSFRPLDTARARLYLAALVGELLSGVHSYLFPCEAVFRSPLFDSSDTPTQMQMSLTDRIDQVRGDRYYRERSSSNYGPVPEPFDYPTPAATAAAEYAGRRFGLLRDDRVEPRSKPRRGQS